MISHGKDIKVFSGNANPKLAEEICKLMGTKLGEAEVGTFSDGEIFVSLYETVRGSDVFVVQSTCTPVNNNLMELLIMIDALKRASAGRITAVIPYYGYARQDRKAKARDPITAKLVANMLTAAGADRVLTMDLHASQIQGFFDIPVDNLAGNPIFVDYYAKKYGSECENMMVVSPDVGSVSRARAFAQKLHMNLAIVDKRRQKANSCEVMNVIGDVRDKDCILFDDMVDTGGSLCNAAKALIEVGGAKSVQACASHGGLSGPAPRESSQFFMLTRTTSYGTVSETIADYPRGGGADPPGGGGRLSRGGQRPPAGAAGLRGRGGGGSLRPSGGVSLRGRARGPGPLR